MYIKALNNGLFGINPGLELTSIDNLSRFIEVSCNMNMLSFEFFDATVLSVHININYNEPPVLHPESSTGYLINCEYMSFLEFFLFHLLINFFIIVCMYVGMYVCSCYNLKTIWSVQQLSLL